MKRIIALMSALLMFAVLSVNAQKIYTTSASGSTVALNGYEQSLKITATAGDTIGGTANKYWIVSLNKPKLQLYSWTIRVDTIKKVSRATGNRVELAFYGSNDASTWVQIGSTIKVNNSTGALADSTFAVSDLSTGILWKYLKVSFTGKLANKCSKPVTIQLKVADK